MADDPTQGDGRRMAVVALVAMWALAFGLSFFLFMTTEPTGDGFTRGINRVGLFFGWQGVAAILALAAFGVSRSLAGSDGLRRAASIPLVITGLVIAGIGAAIAYALWVGG